MDEAAEGIPACPGRIASGKTRGILKVTERVLAA